MDLNGKCEVFHNIIILQCLYRYTFKAFSILIYEILSCRKCILCRYSSSTPGSIVASVHTSVSSVASRFGYKTSSKSTSSFTTRRGPSPAAGRFHHLKGPSYVFDIFILTSQCINITRVSVFVVKFELHCQCSPCNKL